MGQYGLHSCRSGDAGAVATTTSASAPKQAIVISTLTGRKIRLVERVVNVVGPLTQNRRATGSWSRGVYDMPVYPSSASIAPTSIALRRHESPRLAVRLCEAALEQPALERRRAHRVSISAQLEKLSRRDAVRDMLAPHDVDERALGHRRDSGTAFTAKATFSNGCAHFVPTARPHDVERPRLERRKRCVCSAFSEWAVLGSNQ